jgi:hypothetical protein
MSLSLCVGIGKLIGFFVVKLNDLWHIVVNSDKEDKEL